jgi:hypothetical protein
MRRSGLISVCFFALFLAATNLASAGLLGVFQGKIVKSTTDHPPPSSSKLPQHWLYIESRNGSVRRVNVSSARVEYDDDFPPKHRRRNPADALRLRAEVRITAEQDHTDDGSGDWQAQEVLILAPVAAQDRKKDEDKTRPDPARPRTGTVPGVVTTE